MSTTAIVLIIIIVVLILSALLAVSPPSFNVQYKCGESADKTRLCVISEEQLESLIKHNNDVVAKLREINESKSCKFSQASLKAAK